MNLFTASWCEPCRQLKEWLNTQPEELQDKITLVDIDLDDVIAAQAGVRGIPSLQTTDGELINTNDKIRPYLMELSNE
jgi:thioredoxin-like negative regulator of GroEL